ncbi:MAG: metallophosphoesterase [Hyphomicrobiaceae bacterium]|nr:metallophosphoesterase [Hyphomicrobiaceae bacterium]
MFTLAHMSDLHIGPLPAPRRLELVNKRLFGYINWHKSRKGIHCRPTLDRLALDLQQENPDHIAITGDLVNLGMNEEYIQAQKWLEKLGSGDLVSVVPGNHDVYVPLLKKRGIGHWNAFMTNDGAKSHIHKSTRTGFPYVRRRGDVAIIGLSSAIPTMPLVAAGRLGANQRKKLLDILLALGEEKLFRVVLIHHPPMSLAGNWVRGLRDAQELRRVFLQAGAELILHGHDHTHKIRAMKGPAGRIPVVGIPSASVSNHPHKPLARYNLYHIERRPEGWNCQMTGRGLEGASCDVQTLCQLDLSAYVQNNSSFALKWKNTSCRDNQTVD